MIIRQECIALAFFTLVNGIYPNYIYHYTLLAYNIRK